MRNPNSQQVTEDTVLRALYTAATGMEAQQINIDTIANNIAMLDTLTPFRRG